MKELWRKIKHWYWWKFKATDEEKAKWQSITLGTGFMKGGKFIDAKKFYIDPNDL